MRLDGEDWLHFFNAYERDAWRLETQPVYQMPEEEAEFAHFMATGEIPVADDDEWLVRLRHFRSTGRTIGRVHVLTRPLTDYLRFEMAFYAYSSEAGEDIRILDLTDRENPGLPRRTSGCWTITSWTCATTLTDGRPDASCSKIQTWSSTAPGSASPSRAPCR